MPQRLLESLDLAHRADRDLKYLELVPVKVCQQGQPLVALEHDLELDLLPQRMAQAPQGERLARVASGGWRPRDLKHGQCAVVDVQPQLDRYGSATIPAILKLLDEPAVDDGPEQDRDFRRGSTAIELFWRDHHQRRWRIQTRKVREVAPPLQRQDLDAAVALPGQGQRNLQRPHRQWSRSDRPIELDFPLHGEPPSHP